MLTINLTDSSMDHDSFQFLQVSFRDISAVGEHFAVLPVMDGQPG